MAKQEMPQHWRPGIDQTDPRLTFIVDTLMTVITWPCTCPHCTINKGNAANALAYLAGEGGDVAALMRHDPFEGQDEMFDPVPDEVIALCRAHIEGGRHPRRSQRTIAVLSGWLEHIGAGI